MDNRRNFTRYIIAAEVSFKTKDDISKTIQGQVLDISVVGWGAYFKEKIDIGTIIQFDLTAEFLNEHLIGKGKIVNVREHKRSTGNEFRIGTEFMQVDQELILRFISAQQRKTEEQKRKIGLNEKTPNKSGDFGPF